MIKNSTILTEIKGSTATIWLNRPDKHNALNIEMLSGFLIALQHINSSQAVRIIIIRGKGKTFCSGADLNWMQHSSVLTPAENYSECEVLARCFFELYNSPKVTLCLVHGSSIGGGNGFAAASDICVSENSTIFAFSEVRVGLVPATIAPYVIRKTGRAKAMELMLTGRKFTAEQAAEWGLVNLVITGTEQDEYLKFLIEDILNGAPEVQNIIKNQLFKTVKLTPDKNGISQTAELLAKTRTGAEAMEGINAFLTKRKPSWDMELT